MASIRFENVSKRFGSIEALNNVSFEIVDNSFFCLFGPPLSGKSTILKIILGLETLDEGEVFIDDKPMKEVSPAARNIAMVFQNLALFPHMSAEENMRFPLRERGIDKATIAKRVDDVAEKLHMKHILHKPPSQLSGGERQRVAIGRALVRDPVAYLMDDPISALDARLREQTRVELRRMQRDLNHTLVYVTHDQEEAMAVSDQMAILENGRIRQIDAPNQLYDHPNSTYVASMLGSPSINFFEANDSNIERNGPQPGGAAMFGVRPENLNVVRGDGPCHITAIEPMGATTILTLQAGDTAFKSALRGSPHFTLGETVKLSADNSNIHRFDAAGRNMATL